MTKKHHICDKSCGGISSLICSRCGEKVEEGYPHRGLADKGKCDTDREDF